MIYHQRKDNHKGLYTILIIVFLLVIIFLGSFVRGGVQFINGPISSLRNGIYKTFEGIGSFFISKKSLESRVQELENENKTLKIELLSNDVLKEENESLKNILNYVGPDRKFYTLKVITRAPFSPYDTFIVETGDSQTEKDQNVYYQNILIGKVIEKYNKTAVVKMFSSAGEKVNVRVRDIDVEAIGIGGLGFVIKVPKNVEVSEGDLIVSQSESNMVLGSVQSIVANEQSTFQEIYFNYPININDIDFVMIEDKR